MTSTKIMKVKSLRSFMLALIIFLLQIMSSKVTLLVSAGVILTLPNTLTYVFDDVVTQNIIVAPHTFYECENDLRDAIAHPMEYFNISSTEHVKMVQPKCWEVDEDFSEIVGFARQMAQLVKFVDEKEAAKLRIELNKCIREGIDVVPDTF